MLCCSVTEMRITRELDHLNLRRSILAVLHAVCANNLCDRSHIDLLVRHTRTEDGFESKASGLRSHSSSSYETPTSALMKLFALDGVSSWKRVTLFSEDLLRASLFEAFASFTRLARICAYSFWDHRFSLLHSVHLARETEHTAASLEASAFLRLRAIR